MNRTMLVCSECSEHFGVVHLASKTGLAAIKGTTDPTKCDYHTDFTGRAAQKERLMAEWSANHPEGWASV